MISYGKVHLSVTDRLHNKVKIERLLLNALSASSGGLDDMLFNSISYAIFLPCIFLLYWLLPHQYRWIMLLISSYIFYMSWNIKYIVLIFTTTLVSYLCAILIEKTNNPFLKKVFLLLAFLICFGILYIFKYFNFSMEILSNLFAIDPIHINLILPVGISFYTFQTASYVIDVYRGEIKAEKNLGMYALFVSFFPQLVAGPIERPERLLPQIRSEKLFDGKEARYGVRLILWGLYKKMVIADNLAVWVDKVYETPSSFKGFCLLLAAVFFSIQIYCDFSGYSDIARGSAKLLHIDLMENFKSPYFSESIREFWSRWHISLSTWFRDYVYIPMGGNRVSKPRRIVNNLCTFLVSGLWHGASLNFVVWGATHGAGQVYENAFEIKNHKKQDIDWVIRIACVFTFVTFAWVFFRASTLQEAFYILRYMPSGITEFWAYLSSGFHVLGIDRFIAGRILIVYFVPLFIYDFFSLRVDVCAWFENRHIVIRYAYVILLIVLILTYGYVGQSIFVYFQF